jgi:glycolate oxidase FAD binding subunit
VNSNNTNKLVEQVVNAHAEKQALVITAGSSKAFYGNQVEGEILSTTGHSGIIEYQPSELVVTIRSGTLLSELENELKANKQMLAFEPPQHSDNSTIGGAIACGLSGPRRASCGAARDFVLGTTIINGRGEKLKFGGQVMKNVAGYDASRLMVGAQGTLGVLLDISLKVLPINESEITLKMSAELTTAIEQIQRWVKLGLPITASCFLNKTLFIRLGSTHSAVKQSKTTIAGMFATEEIDDNFWMQIKNQAHDFFQSTNNQDTEKLWRCSHQPATEFYGDTDNQLIEWNGALRWIKSDTDLHEKSAGLGGHASRYPLNTKPTEVDIFQPLQAGILKLHRNLKQAFDPENILNPGRLYTDL